MWWLLLQVLFCLFVYFVNFIFYASVAVDSVHIMKLLKKTELLYLDEQRSTTTIQMQIWKIDAKGNLVHQMVAVKKKQYSQQEQVFLFM